MTPPPGHEEPLRLSRSDGRVLVSPGKLTCVFPVPACSNATVLVPEAKTLPRAGFSHLPAQLGGLCPGQAGPSMAPDSLAHNYSGSQKWANTPLLLSLNYLIVWAVAKQM